MEEKTLGQRYDPYFNPEEERQKAVRDALGGCKWFGCNDSN